MEIVIIGVIAYGDSFKVLESYGWNAFLEESFN